MTHVLAHGFSGVSRHRAEQPSPQRPGSRAVNMERETPLRTQGPAFSSHTSPHTIHPPSKASSTGISQRVSPFVSQRLLDLIICGHTPIDTPRRVLYAFASPCYVLNQIKALTVFPCSFRDRSSMQALHLGPVTAISQAHSLRLSA